VTNTTEFQDNVFANCRYGSRSEAVESLAWSIVMRGNAATNVAAVCRALFLVEDFTVSAAAAKLLAQHEAETGETFGSDESLGWTRTEVLVAVEDLLAETEIE
jgi:hypothetical protein